MVMGFAFLSGVFVLMIMSIRVEDKRQNLMTFQQLKAYYMAQAGIQHALLKIRILPNEVYDASALSRGFCPLLLSPPDEMDPGVNASRPKWGEGLAYFIEDIGTYSADGGIPLSSELGRGESADWTYHIESARSLTTFVKAADAADPNGRGKKINVLEIVSVGTIQDKMRSNLSEADADAQRTRSEQVTKVIEITRSAR